MVFAGLLLTGGALGDRLGNRRVFCTGVAVFTVSSAACALARDAPALVAPMMAAGFGTSFALTGTTTTVMAAAPPGCSGTASALFNTARQIGSAAGVALGGTLLATAADQGRCLCLSMAAGALAYLTAAALALRCVPRKS
ncbi:MFS transporter [Actinacidiphila glaucinigra]|uniref:MFS transporter n=1 Tax=Actinacidiphila glaucinigra TaxID=235986 RepID=UPI002E3640C0|nr:MFS transporter [Actinacidiphila glaucinigra]